MVDGAAGAESQNRKIDVTAVGKDIKKKVKLILTGIRRHISDIWSALDVTLLILIGIAIGDWITSAT